jgi:hypothetical protein
MEIFTKNSAKCTVFQSTICNKFSSLMWDKAFDAQLDNHCETGALAEPIPRSEARGINGKKPNILHVHWQNVVKTDGTWKCRACMDSSK